MDPEQIKAFRARQGWTQKQLAKALGVAVPTVSSWEIGNRVPSYHNQVYLEKLMEREKISSRTTELLVGGGLVALALYLFGGDNAKK